MVVSSFITLEQDVMFLHNIMAQFSVFSMNVSTIMVSCKWLDEGTAKSTPTWTADVAVDQYPQIVQTKANNKTFWLP